MQIPKLAKNFLRKTLFAKAVPTNATLAIYKQLGDKFMSERTFYFGNKKLRAFSLAMESAPGTAEMVIQLLESAGAKAGQTVLDFGCGRHQSKYLKQMGFNVHSCDVLPFEGENFTRLDPASPKLPFADRQFDVVMASEVLEHVESPWEILKELARICKNTLIITSPNPFSLHSRERFFKSGFLYWFEPKNFSYHISPIFSWQVELFCQRHNLSLAKVLANHQAFILDDRGKTLEMAEALIYKIDIAHA